MLLLKIKIISFEPYQVQRSQNRDIESRVDLRAMPHAAHAPLTQDGMSELRHRLRSQQKI